MPPNPENPAPQPLIEILEDLAPPELHAAAWTVCMSDRWRFGHGSVAGGSARFWRMELREDEAFLGIWEHVRARCEALAGGPLRMVQLYANGHTYGMGGDRHRDEVQEGAFTLLYYPNPEWREEWDGQTLFYDEASEITRSVIPRPNRAIFFDSRLWHRGTAPSRIYNGLRVSVAYKLERADESTPSAEAVPASKVSAPDSKTASTAPAAQVHETGREGARRTYAARVEEDDVRRAAEERLDIQGASVRLPGFRPGKVPRAVLEERYGAQARMGALKRLASRIVQRDLPAGNVAGSCQLVSGQESGAMEILIQTTYLPDLPDPDFSNISIERLVAADPSTEEAAFLRARFKEQALNRLDSTYAIPLFPGLIEIEFAALWKSAEADQALPTALEERRAFSERLQPIAERRIRLGLIVAELGRRFGIQAASGAELEELTLDHLLKQAKIVERKISPDELREAMEGGK